MYGSKWSDYKVFHIIVKLMITLLIVFFGFGMIVPALINISSTLFLIIAIILAAGFIWLLYLTWRDIKSFF